MIATSRSTQRPLRPHPIDAPLATSRDFLIVALVTVLALFTTASSARADVLLGTTEGFAILAGQTITNTGETTIYGDIGIHPGAAVPPNVTGFETVTQTGDLYDSEGVAETAKADLVIAYDDAAGRDVTATISRELADAELGPGVYVSDPGGDFLLSSGQTLTLTGDADDVWIFKSASTLIFESGSSVVLDGADPCNVFWQVTSSATLETGASVSGTIMALSDISLQGGATLDGRALARNGSVTMINNTITMEACTDDAEEEVVPEVEAPTPAPAPAPAPEPAPVPVETPERVETGAGGATPRSGNPLLAVVLAILAVSAVVGLRRRTSGRARTHP
jgi:hypothetical protein